MLCRVHATQSTWRPRCRLLYSFQSGVCRMQFLKRGRTVNVGFISKGKTKSQIRTLLHFWVLCRLQRACSSLAVRERCNTLYLDFLPELCSSFQLHLSDHCTVFCTFQDHFILTRCSSFCLYRLWAGWTLLHAVCDCCQAPCCGCCLLCPRAAASTAHLLPSRTVFAVSLLSGCCFRAQVVRSSAKCKGDVSDEAGHN